MRIGVPPAWVERNPAELRTLEQRADELDVVVSTRHLDTRHEPDGKWRVRVRRGEDVTELLARGPLGAIIAGALDDWEEQREPEADPAFEDDPGPSVMAREGLPEFNGAWTADEILTVAHQSGIVVRRA